MGHAETGRDLADGQPLRPQLAGPLDPLLPPTLSRRDRPGQPAKHSGPAQPAPPPPRPWSAGRPAGQDRCRPDRPRTGPRPRPAAARLTAARLRRRRRRTARRSRARPHSRPPGARQHGRQRPGRARPGQPARRGGRGPQRRAQRARPGRAGADRTRGGGTPGPCLPRASRGATSLNPSFGLFTDASALWSVTSRSRCGEQPLSVRVGASDGIRGHLAVVTPAAAQESSSRSPGSLEHGSSNARAPGLCSRSRA